MTVRKENVRAWVAALRSGKYHQGKDRLARTFTDGRAEHCCLGVACEAARAAGLDLTVEHAESLPGPDGEYTRVRYDGRADLLPPAVQQWLGIEQPSPSVVLDGGNVSLVQVNDTDAMDFATIAHLIEATYLAGGQGE